MKLTKPVDVTDWVDGDTWTVTDIEQFGDGHFYFGHNPDKLYGLVYPTGRQLARLERIAERMFTDQLTLGGS